MSVTQIQIETGQPNAAEARGAWSIPDRTPLTAEHR